MEGIKRRKMIIELLQKSDQPLSGTILASRLDVSRQVIVQDIALLRANNKNILSTNKGYLFFQPDDGSVTRVFHVRHGDDDIQDELNCIVDNGGRLLDVVIDHNIYGQISADLRISSRRDVLEFLEQIKERDAHPLSLLTDGDHYHTVEADTESILENIEEELSKRGFLV